MTKPIFAVAVAVGVLVTACGSNTATGPQDVAPNQQTPAAASIETHQAGVTVGTVVPAGEVTSSARALVTPGKGGKVQVDLGEGVQATLTVPAGAVAEEVVVTLRAFRSGRHQGLLMEPDGLWLTKPAALTFNPKGPPINE